MWQSPSSARNFVILSVAALMNCLTALLFSMLLVGYAMAQTSCTSNKDCADAEFCGSDYDCKASSGVCTPIPDVCPDGFAVACGCDGITYQNDCEAHKASVSVFSNENCVDNGDGITSVIALNANGGANANSNEGAFLTLSFAVLCMGMLAF